MNQTCSLTSRSLNKETVLQSSDSNLLRVLLNKEQRKPLETQSHQFYLGEEIKKGIPEEHVFDLTL